MSSIDIEKAVVQFRKDMPEMIVRRIIEAERVGDVCGFDGLQEVVPEIRDAYLRQVETRKQIKKKVEDKRDFTVEDVVDYVINDL